MQRLSVVAVEISCWQFGFRVPTVSCSPGTVISSFLRIHDASRKKWLNGSGKIRTEQQFADFAGLSMVRLSKPRTTSGGSPHSRDWHFWKAIYIMWRGRERWYDRRELKVSRELCVAKRFNKNAKLRIQTNLEGDPRHLGYIFVHGLDVH